MTTTIAILLLAAVSYTLRSMGLAVPDDDTRLDTFAAPLTAAVLASLIVTTTVTNGTDLTVDARLVGLIVAAAAATARLPLTATLLLAVAATALTRGLT